MAAAAHIHKHPRRPNGWVSLPLRSEINSRVFATSLSQADHLDLAVCSSRSEVQVSSDTSKMGSLISHHHPHCLLSCSERARKLRTSNYHFRPHHLSSGLRRCPLELFVFPPFLLLLQSFWEFLAQSKHVLLWCSGLHIHPPKKNVLICFWIPTWRHLPIVFLLETIWGLFWKALARFLRDRVKAFFHSFYCFIALLPDSRLRHAAGLL